MSTERFYTTTPSMRGHVPKLSRILDLCHEKGIPPGLRPVELQRWILAAAVELGYASSRGEWPSRTAIGRNVIVL